jgi:hypothetical protein
MNALLYGHSLALPERNDDDHQTYPVKTSHHAGVGHRLSVIFPARIHVGHGKQDCVVLLTVFIPVANGAGASWY